MLSTFKQILDTILLEDLVAVALVSSVAFPVERDFLVSFPFLPSQDLREDVSAAAIEKVFDVGNGVEPLVCDYDEFLREVPVVLEYPVDDRDELGGVGDIARMERKA